MPKTIVEPGCDGCSLKGHIRLMPIVSEETSDAPRTLFIGEAPLDSEVKAGRLTEGRDGGLFSKMIERFEVTNYAFTNVCLCYPGKGNKPKVTNMASCSLWLKTFIKDYNPDRIICLGKLAAKAVLGKELGKIKMYTLREQSPFVVFPDMLGPPSPIEGKDVFVTYNPKAIFKQPKLIDDFVADLDFVFNPPEPTFIEPKVTYLKTWEEWLEWFEAINPTSKWFDMVSKISWEDPVALDFETTGLHPIADRPVTIGLSWSPWQALVVNLQDMKDL